MPSKRKLSGSNVVARCVSLATWGRERLAARSPVPGKAAPATESSSCAICGATAQQLVAAHRDLVVGGAAIYAMYRCLGCGCVYQYPQPSPAAMVQHYPAEYPVYTLPLSAESWLQRRVRRYGLRKRCRIVTRHQPAGRLLDVGCATGDFLNELRRDSQWTTLGVDPIAVAARGARQSGLDCVRAVPEAMPFGDHSFDALTLWDSLEACHYPLAALAEAARLLRPNGLLVINHVNLRSLDRWVFGGFWCGYELPRHLFLLSAPLLDRWLQQHGLAVVERRCRYGSYSTSMSSVMFAFEGRFGRSPWTRALSRLLRSVPCRVATLPLYWIVDRAGRGSNIAAIYRKVAPPNTADQRQQGEIP